MLRGLVSIRSVQFPDFEPVYWAEAGLRRSPWLPHPDHRRLL